MNTCDTVVQVCGMLWCAKNQNHTCTRNTHFGITVSLHVPVFNPVCGFQAHEIGHYESILRLWETKHYHWSPFKISNAKALLLAPNLHICSFQPPQDVMGAAKKWSALPMGPGSLFDRLEQWTAGSMSGPSFSEWQLTPPLPPHIHQQWTLTSHSASYTTSLSTPPLTHWVTLLHF